MRDTLNVLVPTPLGLFRARFHRGKLAALEFPRAAVLPAIPAAHHAAVVLPRPARGLARQLNEYLRGRRRRFSIPLDGGGGTPLERRVWAALRRIPFGQTTSYGALARQIGRAGAARAVGGACGRNPIPILIPCHRVVSSGGGLGGFSAGMRWKKRLLALEARLGEGPATRGRGGIGGGMGRRRR